MNLVIVESPTKAKTIGSFLKKGFMVKSSFGHIRDLPKSHMGIDIEHDFEPKYEIPKKAQKTVTELKKLAKKAVTVWFATDADREGESISWHLVHALGVSEEKTKRIAFHEITKSAIQQALEHPRKINRQLVDAQQARRVLDRLVGYELSPFLWEKVARGLSAGRVQSALVRLLVEREREIQAFRPEEYWTLDALFEKNAIEFESQLIEWQGRRLEKFSFTNEKDAHAVRRALMKDSFVVKQCADKSVTRSSAAPFTTSTLQQEANKRLRLSAKQTMYFAQELYEGVGIGSEGTVGLITYMRTDSVNLADEFLAACETFIKKTFGAEYASRKIYAKKQKLAQEAHEAIRPTDAERTPEAMKQYLSGGQWKVYNLIWRRAVASQMAGAKGITRSIDIEGEESKGVFRASGTTISFEGFLKLYPESLQETRLPELVAGAAVTAKSITQVQHFTEAPARYSEATLIKMMEELGIGRPSTYAPTISTVIDRGYAEKFERKLKPTDLAFTVTDLLVKHFPNIVDYQFTATMEDHLDEIANGGTEWVPIVREFYTPFKENLERKKEEISKKDITEEATDQVCEKCGRAMVIKIGRFGKFLACSGYPDCKNTKQLKRDQKGDIDVKESNAQTKESELTDETCEKCGKPMVKKVGRFGEFLGCSGYPECRNIKNILKTVGVKCPACRIGDIAERRSRSGKFFYSCSRYPDCTFALWQKPTGEYCPECTSLLVFAAKGMTKCSNKECGFEKEQTE